MPRPPSDRMLPTAVTLRFAVLTNDRGTPDWTYTEALRRASVQEMSSGDVRINGLEANEKGFNVFFGPPDPGLKEDDLIVVPGLGTLSCLGAAEDADRRGVVFRVRARGLF